MQLLTKKNSSLIKISLIFVFKLFFLNLSSLFLIFNLAGIRFCSLVLSPKIKKTLMDILVVIRTIDNFNLVNQL